MSNISSPCQQICVLDLKTGFCIGCGRLASEIADWSGMSEEKRLQIMTLLPERLARLEDEMIAASDKQ